MATVSRIGFPPVQRGSFRSEVWVFIQCVVVYVLMFAYLIGLFLVIRAAI